MTARAILALDLGTKLGWALRHADGRIESGMENFAPSASEGEGLRFLRFRAWLHDTKRRLETAGETLALVQWERNDFLNPGAFAAAVSFGMRAHLQAWCEHHKIPYPGTHSATIKKAVTGSGHAKKPAVRAAMRKLGFAPGSTDEADALALLHTGAAA